MSGMKSKQYDLASYRKMLRVLEEDFQSILIDDYASVSKYDIKEKIAKLKLETQFGFNIGRLANNDFYKIDYHQGVGFYGEGHCQISYPESGKQPDGEWLYQVCFPSGAYTFDKSYPVETFNTFFAELKAFGPAHCDSVNNSLYFNVSNAKKVYEVLDNLYLKYKKLVDNELKERRIKELEEQLNKLKEE